MSRPEHRHDDDRTGNGIVNHGPESTPNTDPEQDGERKQDAVDGADSVSGNAAPREDADGDGAGDRSPGGTADRAGGGTLTELFAGRGGSLFEDAGRSVGPAGAAGPSGSADAGGDVVGGGMDEVALRRMLQGAVQGLEPSDGTLDHLHRAVPARRARRRQGVVGAAAAALLIGTAVPAFVHVANSEGSATANPAIAGHGEQAQGGSGEDAGTDAGGGRPAGPEERRSEGAGGEDGGSTAPSKGSEPGAEGSGTEGLGDDAAAEAAAATACEPGQLGVASAAAGPAGADGTVYGTFRIANESGAACSVTSNGTVGFQAAGAADPLKITVVQHTAGDPAAGLPDPSLEPGTVLLRPTMAYEVRFAWVPSDTCPTTGGSPSPTPTDGDGSGGGSGGGGDTAGTAAGASDTAVQFGSADEGPAQGSIAVTHTPEAGAPTAAATIDNACAGTIYRTGVLDAS
ncbi:MULTISPECIES: hypothetical protein [unclassified Streptomyces]|uniref:hypothetical protein n=1 Tax=unclassified Streptomyces TaxID=2593676 RepID=UPI0035DAEE8A